MSASANVADVAKIGECIRMRLRPHFADTYAGIITLGLVFSGAPCLISAAMFFFRPFCEPILKLALPIFARLISKGYSHYHYDPNTYWFLDGYVAFLGVLILLIAVVTMIKKPAQDQRIDHALRQRATKYSHGAPLDPE